MSAFSKKLEELILESWNLNSLGAYLNWKRRAEAFLQVTEPELAGEFRAAHDDGRDWGENLSAFRGVLEGQAARSIDREAALSGLAAVASAQLGGRVSSASKKVFVVHGHDTGTKEQVARFIERLGLDAIILHEQPSHGRTVIEKIEEHAEVGFAVVLLTPDDVGAAAAEAANLKKRARQNVVLELGYFVGKLGRSRVCALYKKEVEIPSDFKGVVYVEFDDGGGWRAKLAQEFSSAGLPIKLEGILKS